jgi:hypothetical protein
VQYLGANVPQAWAAGSVIHLITTLAGLDPDAPNHRLVVRPGLPTWLDEIRFGTLCVGGAEIDLRVYRRASGGHGIDVEPRQGELDVVLEDG